MSITSFWIWLNDTTSLCVNGISPKVNGIRNVRAGFVFARLTFENKGTIRLTAEDSNSGLNVKIMAESESDEIKNIQREVVKILEKKLSRPVHEVQETIYET